jgi:epoxide hydrolase-like predicted phosphatase
MEIALNHTDELKGLTVLIVGTVDTKSDELSYLRSKVESLGAQVLLMDVSVLEDGEAKVDISKHTVAKAALTSINEIAALSDENLALNKMALGASLIAAQLYADHKIHGLLALGGTLGTDLALDVASALPMGVPKVIVSTVAYSHLLPPERITPDLMMILWAGGLYGLNDLCKSTLAQAAGCVVGAILAADIPRFEKPIVGITSLGKSCLNYMVRLKPALEARGFDVAVFHSTGMGGRAFEAMAAQGKFACVLDLCLQELANHVGGSCVTSGADRLLGAGRSGTPQIVAPGAADMIDFPTWQAPPNGLDDRAVHVHNRLIASATSPIPLRQEVSRQIVARLAKASAATHLVMPLGGVQAWDRAEQPLHDPQGLAAMSAAIAEHAKLVAQPQFTFTECPHHINDEAFSNLVLNIFDDWLAKGIVTRAAANKAAPPKALIFDFGGVISRTLFETHALSEKALGLAAGSLTWRGPFAPEADKLWQRMQADEITERDYWLTRSKEVGALLGEDWHDMQTLVQRSRGDQPNDTIRPEAVGLIAMAKAKGLRLAILTNEMDMFYGQGFRDKLGLLKHFDVITDATYTGILKPNAKAYLTCLEALELKAQDCVFIDDQERNIKGGLDVGLRCVWFDVKNPQESFDRVKQML